MSALGLKPQGPKYAKKDAITSARMGSAPQKTSLTQERSIESRRASDVLRWASAKAKLGALVMWAR